MQGTDETHARGACDSTWGIGQKKGLEPGVSGGTGRGNGAAGTWGGRWEGSFGCSAVHA